MEIFLKIFGFCLLVAGLLVVGWSLMFSYNILTGEGEIPEIVKMPEPTSSQKSTGGDIQAQMEQMIGEQMKSILPAESIGDLMNLIIWSVLAFIFIFGGSQISSLGIKLIRK